MIRFDYGGLVRLLSGTTLREGDHTHVLSPTEAEQVMQVVVGSEWFAGEVHRAVEQEFARAAEDIDNGKKFNRTVSKWLEARGRLYGRKGSNADSDY